MSHCLLYKNQTGISIISLMVGLLVSMLCILASLTLYKNLVGVAADTKMDAVHDGNISSAMLTIQKEVMAAGFGIVGAGINDVVANPVAANGGTPASIELLWRYIDDTGVVCRGIREYQDDRGGITYRILRAIEATAANGCSQNGNLINGMTWTLDDNNFIGQWPLVGELQTYVATNNTLFDFTVGTQNCAPYGSQNSASRYTVTARVPSALKLNNIDNAAMYAAVDDITYTYCLINTTGP